MPVDPVAARHAAEHLDRLDRAVPGLVVGLYVIGSAVLDDYHPGRSDLDLVAQTTHRPTSDEFAAITTAHQGDGTHVEAVYVTSDWPDVGPSPYVRDGQPHYEDAHKLSAITRLQLAAYATTLRGDPPSLPIDVPAAREYCRGNLTSYWLPLLDRVAPLLDQRGPDDPVDTGSAIWIGLGPVRLWHTLRTGEIVSKSRAGELAAGHWPDLAPCLTDIVAVRRGAAIPLTTPHGRAAIEVGRRVMAEARTM